MPGHVPHGFSNLFVEEADFADLLFKRRRCKWWLVIGLFGEFCFLTLFENRLFAFSNTFLTNGQRIALKRQIEKNGNYYQKI